MIEDVHINNRKPASYGLEIRAETVHTLVKPGILEAWLSFGNRNRVLLAIASFIIHYSGWQLTTGLGVICQERRLFPQVNGGTHPVPRNRATRRGTRETRAEISINRLKKGLIQLFSHELSLSDHFEHKKIPVNEALVTQCCPGIGMVVLVE
jgi:hypothetical protein